MLWTTEISVVCSKSYADKVNKSVVQNIDILRATLHPVVFKLITLVFMVRTNELTMVCPNGLEICAFHIE